MKTHSRTESAHSLGLYHGQRHDGIYSPPLGMQADEKDAYRAGFEAGRALHIAEKGSRK